MNEAFSSILSKRYDHGCPPIWFMRQAGRYHSHYQKLKEKYSFMELCKIPELASEVALGPIKDFDFDIAILFSDLLFPLEVLGLGLEYSPGPILGQKLCSLTLSNMKSISLSDAIEKLKFQEEAVRKTRQKLTNNKSLIGFVGGPWTLYCYAVEGSHAGSLVAAKSQPELYQNFSEILVPLLIENIQLQLQGGAELVMVLDTAAGELSSKDFRNLCVPALKKIAQKFPGRLGYYGKGMVIEHLDDPCFSELYAGIGVDHRWNLVNLLKQRRFGFVQGNFDQCLLFLETSLYKKNLENYFGDFKSLSKQERSRWVCGLGHGVLPKTPEHHVKYFVERARELFS